MFTVHFIDATGTVTSTAYWESQHMATARRFARALAHGANTPILIRRDTPSGHIPVVIVMPDGTFMPPHGTKPASEMEACKKPGVCFCTPCRAARRA